ncbi:protein FAM161B-like [Dendronephthya gigantea]|uniref:protein FAM161B-like n=1 Tax=Dendronephthya gigantea TaxID=151771 RepID=UPI00106B07CE|nr:protein FAM161B-like [Dendronephthya gigantea]
MATTHAFAVVKNNCYKAPRLSNTDMPASMKEINEQTSFSQSSEGDEVSLDDRNRRKTRSSTGRKRHINKGRDKFIQSFEAGDDVSEEQFYENLLKLREEHKKTLKFLETKYYNELRKEKSFQWQGFQEGVGLSESNSTANIMEKRDMDKSHGKNPKSSTRDFVKDLSHLTNGSVEDRDESDESFDESEDEVVMEEKASSPSTPEEFSSSLFPKRSATMDMVEHLWKDFSVQDYTAVDDDTLETAPAGETEKMAKEKEWTPSITVPKPFTMTLREATKEKRKTRSMQMLEEELVLKKSMEEVELKKKFRAQPVPATTFLPLYDDIMDKNKRRSEHIRDINKAILKATEKPFSFVKREEMKKHLREEERRKAEQQKAREETKRASFKAKPPPKHQDDLTLADRQTEEDEYRKIRKKLRAAELLAQSRLPPSMEARENVTAAAKSRKKCRKSREQKSQFRPNINPDVPDFDALHWEFEKELRKRKKERQPTVVEPFHLKTAHIPRAKSTLIRARSMENLSRSVGDSPSVPRKRQNRPYSARLSSSQDTLPFGTTESVRLRDSAVRKSLEVQKQKNDETLKAKRARQKREKELRSQVTVKAMANDHSWQLRNSSKQKLKSFKESESVRQEEYENELAEMNRRVEQRPLLFERESQENARRKAEKKYKQILRDAGVDDHLVSRLVTKDGNIIDADDSDGSAGDLEGRNGDDDEYPLSDHAARSGSENSHGVVSDQEYEDD